MQPEPFGEHKALRYAALASCGSIGIVGCIWVVVRAAVVAVVGSGRMRGLETTEHRV